MDRPRFPYQFIIDGYSGCFYFLALVNNAAVSTDVQISLLSILLGIDLEGGLPGHRVILFLIFTESPSRSLE